MAARPAGRRHDRDHRPRPRADRPRARLVARGGHRRRADHPVVDAPRRSTRFAAGRSCPRRAVRPGLHRRAQARVQRLPRRRSPTAAGSRPARSIVADNVLWSGRVVGCPPGERRTTANTPRCARSASGPGRPALPGHDPAARATACSSPRWRGRTRPLSRCASVSGCSRSSASWPARARSRSSSPTARRSRAPGTRSWRCTRSSRPARRRSASPATGRTPMPATALADGDEVAMIPPVSGGAAADDARARDAHPRAPRGAVRRRPSSPS